MARIAYRCKLAVLVLFLALLTPWSAEALPLDRSVAEPLASAVSRITEFLAAWLGEVGCSMDPGGSYGTNQPAPPTDNVDVGCSADPSGVCGSRG
jgi:hypothetical protein